MPAIDILGGLQWRMDNQQRGLKKDKDDCDNNRMSRFQALVKSNYFCTYLPSIFQGFFQSITKYQKWVTGKQYLKEFSANLWTRQIPNIVISKYEHEQLISRTGMVPNYDVKQRVLHEGTRTREEAWRVERGLRFQLTRRNVSVVPWFTSTTVQTFWRLAGLLLVGFKASLNSER